LTYLLDELADCLPSLSPDVAEWVCQLDRLGREMELRRQELDEVERDLQELEEEIAQRDAEHEAQVAAAKVLIAEKINHQFLTAWAAASGAFR